MTVVGFDVAKKNVVAAVLSSDGSVTKQGCTMNNTDEALLQWLKAVRDEVDDELITCCESTGYYQYPLLRVATALNIPCRVLNPILTKQAVKATVRGKKTDRSDAVLIARLGLQGEGQLHTSADTSGKQLLRVVTKLSVLAQTIANIQRSMDERQVLLPDCAVEDLDTAVAAIQKAREACSDEAATAMDDALVKRLSSITGVGTLTARVIIAEIGDMSRFTSVDRLVAFSGLDPRVRQSGISLHRNTKLTKRGSPHLRRAIFLAANVMRQHDPEVKAYYERKRSEGRTHTETMMPVCRKLLARVHAVWLREKGYVKHEVVEPSS